MTFAIDGERFETHLREQLARLIESAAERHRQDDEVDAEGQVVHPDHTALRMDGGVVIVQTILDSLRQFEASGTPRRRQTPLAEVEVAPQQLVRQHARGTSWEAALSITSEKRQRMYRAIYLILSKLGPMTDHEIREAMEARSFTHSWSGLSARRVEMERAGWVVDTGQKRKTQFGKMATVWAAVPEET